MPDTMIQPEVTAAISPPRNRSPEIKELAGALAKAQGAMENAKKDQENPGFKRDGKNAKYADLASVWSAIREPLSTNGLAVMQWPRTVDGGVEIETELLHESGQFMRDILWMPCPQMTVHTVGSAITYGRRYALMAIVGIAPEEDDGNAAAGVNGDQPHKPGSPGSAGGGGDFRPAGPRRQSSWGEGGKQGAVNEAAKDGLIAKPKAAPDAVTQMQWCKTAIAGFKDMTSRDALKAWWRESKDERETAETALPVEFDKVIVAFDARMDALPAAVVA